MNLDLANTDKLNEFYEELKRLKIDVVLPSINQSFADFAVKENKLYYALAAIKAVGFESVNQIIANRKDNGPFKSLEDFILRIDSKLINKLQMEGLIKSGAFDCLETNRKYLFDVVPEIIKISKNYKVSNLLQNNLFDSDKTSKLSSLENFVSKKDTWSQNEKMKNEFESIGFFISKHPLLNYEKILKTYKVKKFSDIGDNDLNKEFVLSGTLMAVQEKKTAKGQPFAIIKLSDLSRMYELFIFSEILLANRDKMLPGNSFLINIIKEKMTNGTTRLTVRKLTEINSIKEAKISNVEIVIKDLESINELKKILKDNGDTIVLIRMNSKDKNYVFNLKTNKLIDASVVNILNSSGFDCKIY
jgi:DNA polymerase-3 subunit alpha